MKMKGNTMTKKTVVVLVGLVVLAFVTVAVYAATYTGVTLTKDTSITNAEVTIVEACGQYCGRDCDKDCDDCDGNCESCANCDKRGKCQGYKFGKCGGHGNGI